jgi:hypothetical protein
MPLERPWDCNNWKPIESVPKIRKEIPYTESKNGVKYCDYRSGKRDAVVQAGSKVAVEMTIRCQSFSTTAEPGGVKYYSTKEDTEFNELAFVVGLGDVLPKFWRRVWWVWKRVDCDVLLFHRSRSLLLKRPINYPYLPPRMERVALRVYLKRMRRSCLKSWWHEWNEHEQTATAKTLKILRINYEILLLFLEQFRTNTGSCDDGLEKKRHDQSSFVEKKL